MDKKVSIIVPVYKSEKFLKQLIESIINQTYDNIELILVDDGSPDKSASICDEYQKKDKRVIVIHQENKGTCEARNAGLKVASGYYITFADGDDWMELDCIKYLVELIERNDCDMSMTDSIFTTIDRKQNNSDNIVVVDSEQATCDILYDKIPVGPWNKLYKHSIIREHNLNFSVSWFGEGLYFSVMHAQLSNRVAIGHRKVYNYRLNNPNSGTTIMKVEHGINALNNILYIYKNLIVNTPRTQIASKWHIWQNNYNLMMYIVGNNAIKNYKKTYKESRKYLLLNVLSIVLKSEISVKNKIIILLKAFFPGFFISRSLRIKKKNFNGS